MLSTCLHIYNLYIEPSIHLHIYSLLFIITKNFHKPKKIIIKCQVKHWIISTAKQLHEAMKSINDSAANRARAAHETE